MPSVGMRRSTRVFVPKSVLKDSDEPRVLRSGKRLWSAKPGRGSEDDDDGDDEWFPMLGVGPASAVCADGAAPCSKSGNNGWRRKVLPKRSSAIRRFSRRLALPEPEPEPEPEPHPKRKRKPKPVTENENKKFGTGYGRKKPRLGINVTEASVVSSSSSSPSSSTPSGSSQSGKRVLMDQNRMYGNVYARQRRRRGAHHHHHHHHQSSSSSSGTGISEVDSHGEVLAGNIETSLCVVSTPSIAITVDRSCDNGHLFTNFLVSVLKFMRRSSTSVRLSELAVFMCSEPIAQTFSQRGIHITDFSSRTCCEDDIYLHGNCNIFGARESAPLFCLSFSAAAQTFSRLHFRFFLRSQRPLDQLVRYLMGLPRRDYVSSSSSSYIQEQHDNEIVVSMNVEMSGESTTTTTTMNDVNSLIRSSRLGVRSTANRLNVNSRSIRRRRSLISSRVRRPSSLSLRNKRRCSNGGSLVKSNHPGANKVGDEVLGSIDTLESNKQKNNNFMKPNQSLDSMCCSAHILVVEADKCYREEGAKVMMEYIDSREWCLAVKKHDTIRFTHTAEYGMLSSTQNRVTLSTVWTSRKGWKLEFFNKQDWYTFKELYKECVNRNIYATTAKEVPIPGVREVPHHGDDNCVPFVRPNDYIQVLDDEVERAISRKTANYEMDSGDEEWLEGLNNGFRDGDDGPHNHVTHDMFEELIDIFEKASYCNQDEVSAEDRATQLCKNFRTDLVAAVYQYWVGKRKLKNKALLRVFQSAPPRRSPALPQTTVLRKRRSFKRQGGKPGRQRFFLQDFREEQEQEARRRAEEAQNAAKTAKELFILKRRRAEELAVKADLAFFKAALALTLAKAAQDNISSEQFVAFINE